MQQTFRRLIGIGFLVVGFLQTSTAQNQKIDSLKALLESRSGKQKIELEFELARAYLDVDNAIGFDFAHKAFESAHNIDDSLLLVKTGRVKAQAFRRLGRIDPAITLFEELIPIAKRNSFVSETKHLLNGISVTYLVSRKYDKALRHLFDFLQLEEIKNDKFWKGTALNNIGLVYHNLKDYDNAILYYNQSLETKFGGDDEEGINVTLTNVSLCLANKRAFHEARSLVHQVFSRCNYACSDDISKSLFSNLGTIEFLEGNYTQAKKEFIKTYQLAIASKDKKMVLEALGYLVRIGIRTKDVEESINYFEELDSLANSGLPCDYETLRAYYEFSILNNELGNFETAAFYQNKYVVRSDSLFNEELARNLMRIEAAHLQQENNAKIEAQSKILALNEELIRRQRYLNVVVGIVALLLIGFVILLIRSNEQKQRLNKILDHKVQQRTRELESSRDVLQRAFDERDIFISKTAGDMRNFIATIKGLCHLGARDSLEASHYLERVSETSEGLSEVVDKFSHRKLILETEQ